MIPIIPMGDIVRVLGRTGVATEPVLTRPDGRGTGPSRAILSPQNLSTRAWQAEDTMTDREALRAKLLAEELENESLALIRFFIEDHAFSTEFLVTVVQEYFQKEYKRKEEPR